MKNREQNAQNITISMDEYKALNETIESKNEYIREIEKELAWLKERLLVSNKNHFGSDSEKIQIGDQLTLFANEAEFINDRENNVEEITVPEHKRRKRKNTIDCLPDNIESYVVEYKLNKKDRQCPECGTEMKEIGHTDVTYLEIVPAQYKVRIERTYKYGCDNCKTNNDKDTIVEASRPNPVIKGGFATPSTIAHIITQKFGMHSPLYRQEMELKNKDIELSRQTMSN